MRIPRFVVLGSAILVCAFALVSPPTAFADTATSVTMFSDPGEYIGQGKQRAFDASNSTITVRGNASGLTVTASGGSVGDQYTFDFSAPPGEQLAARSYTADRQPGAARLDISGGARGCSANGRFDVKDIVFSSSGALTRLWLTYEQHCGLAAPALFGEIRFAVPGYRAGAPLTPGYVSWPDTYPGAASTIVPVRVVNVGPSDVPITGASVSGVDRDDFQITLDECSATTLPSGGACQVWIRFVPSVAGPRVASLLVTASTRPARPVVLDGFGIPGNTDVTMQSDSGDFIGGGQTYSYSPANALLSASGTSSHLHLNINGADGSNWTADFTSPSGATLGSGDYPNATRYPFNTTGPGLDVSGNGRGCNRISGAFTVRQLVFNTDGSPRYFAVTFEQHCEERVPALRGEINYRVPVGDTTPPASVSNLRVSRSGKTWTTTWANPTNSDFAATIVRYACGTTVPVNPYSGRFAYIGTGGAASLGTCDGRPLSVSVFAVDASGNIGQSASATVGF